MYFDRKREACCSLQVVMAPPPSKVVVKFPLLLKKITRCLGISEPTYRVLDKTTKNTRLSVRDRRRGVTHVYLGGQADSVEESVGRAAREAVRDLMKIYGVTVEDVTSNKLRDMRRCTSLYRLKRIALETAEKGTPNSTVLIRSDNNVNNTEKHVCVDYLAILNTIYKQFWIDHSPIETLEAEPGNFISWCTVSASCQKLGYDCMFSEHCSCPDMSQQDLAKKMIFYLMPIYNFEVVDANYNYQEIRRTTFLCTLERESCLTLMDRAMGTRKRFTGSGSASELQCHTPADECSRIPSRVDPPLPPQKRRCVGELGAQRGGQLLAGGLADFFEPPPEFEAAYRRTMRPSDT